MLFHKIKTIVKDLAALSLLQLVTMVMPVLMIPFLATALGKEQLGQLALFQAIAFYIALAVEFGMDFSGTRHTSKYKDDRGIISSYFFSVLTIKSLIILLCAILLLIFELIFQKVGYALLLYCIGIGVFQGLNINWFYQGIGKVRIVSMGESTIKTLMSCLIIYCSVISEINVDLVLLLLCVSNALTFVFSYTLVFKCVTYIKPSLTDLKSVIKGSTKLFAFKFMSNTYSSGGVIILGVLAPIEYAGFYSYADKILRSVRGAVQPLIRLIFAKVSSLSRKSVHKPAFKAIALIALINTSLALVIHVYSDTIVNVLFGEGWDEVSSLLKYMVILLPIIGFNTSVTMFYLMPLGEDSYLIKLICIFSLLYCLISPFLVNHLYDFGALISLVVVEVLIMILLALKVGTMYSRIEGSINANS
ncbi:oligosaccharide flippase family protein [Vibrio kyushuensis]|uniref:oligosaccharide flippase family protein n=1 Tax=Vibrio kyushuensis TaxID=2910249 RepID=UPI003D0A5758